MCPLEKLTALLDHGIAPLGQIFTPAQCQEMIKTYDTGRFRSHIHMARYNFGRGDYKYYAYPLPEAIQSLRENLYAQLVPLARLWADRTGTRGLTFPDQHSMFIRHCHTQGQKRPTPLILKYQTGDYNCLHQDLYGALYFPFQVVIQLNRPGHDFSGGEFILTETRPRRQTRAQVVPLAQGEAAVFAVNYRPEKSARGYARVTLRHGVSPLRWGTRHALGIIFHDGK
tara:strand:+ start:10644 stop:11324 length:681 start_codon:yes stop_codon:yes gene_type:complete